MPTRSARNWIYRESRGTRLTYSRSEGESCEPKGKIDSSGSLSTRHLARLFYSNCMEYLVLENGDQRKSSLSLSLVFLCCHFRLLKIERIPVTAVVQIFVMWCRRSACLLELFTGRLHLVAPYRPQGYPVYFFFLGKINGYLYFITGSKVVQDIVKGGKAWFIGYGSAK